LPYFLRNLTIWSRKLETCHSSDYAVIFDIPIYIFDTKNLPNSIYTNRYKSYNIDHRESSNLKKCTYLYNNTYGLWWVLYNFSDNGIIHFLVYCMNRWGDTKCPYVTKSYHWITINRGSHLYRLGYYKLHIWKMLHFRLFNNTNKTCIIEQFM